MNTRRPTFSDNLPGTIEEVFADFKGRRAGLVKAFTTDFKTFFQHCDPGRDNLSLYGFPDETWEVNEPDELVPPEAPEPTLGINFARDEIGTDEWLALVAVHSDVWLLALTFSLGANIGLNKAERMRLFNMINKLPTLVEVVTGAAANPNPQQKGKSAASKGRRAKSTSKGRGGTSKQKQKDESDEDKEGESTCGACGREYVEDEFWIFCDICEKWYHGACVGINPAAAEHIKKFRCPACCR